MMSFGKKLKQLRTDQNVSLKTLSDVTGYSVRTIIYWEAEQYIPKSKNVIITLAKFFHVSIYYFYDYRELLENPVIQELQQTIYHLELQVKSLSRK
jgi:transcriptional regulator with XRE-family HTH domain